MAHWLRSRLPPVFGRRLRESAFAPALGVIIHLALSIALAALAVPLLSRLAARYSGAGVTVGSAMLMLAVAWKMNFFIILPLVNPAFAALMPHIVTLVSKLLFGMAMGLVMYKICPGAKH